MKTCTWDFDEQPCQREALPGKDYCEQHEFQSHRVVFRQGYGQTPAAPVPTIEEILESERKRKEREQ